MSDIKIVLEGGEGEIEEKKSRFIAHVKSVSSEDEAVAYIAEIKKKYWDARHNCSAFVIGEKNPIMRFSDDGEPQGTAGKPMLDVITGNGICNVVVVVTRYFGGVLLGTGGLVRAYQKSTQAGIANSKLAVKYEGISNTIKTDYNDFGKIQYIAANEGIRIDDIEYGEDVKVKFTCMKSDYDGFEKKIVEATAARAFFGEKMSVDYLKEL